LEVLLGCILIASALHVLRAGRVLVAVRILILEAAAL
jgi:hypothetical protein